MDAHHFETALADLAAILGDPTRRGIYMTTRESPVALTAGDIAESFGIHPNVARHHLDRLVEQGYVEVTAPPPGRSTAPGRPPRHYRATGKDILITYPPRRYDLLSELLVQVIEQLDPDAAPMAAERVGRRFGRKLAAETGLSGGDDPAAALAAVSAALETIGFSVAPGPDASLLTNHCPFGTTAADHPDVVCRIDQGIVGGLLEAASGRRGEVVTSPHDGPDEACVTEV